MFPFRNRIADLCALVKLGEDRRGSKHGFHLRVLSHHCTPAQLLLQRYLLRRIEFEEEIEQRFFFLFPLFSHSIVNSFLVESSECNFTLVIVSLLTPDIESLLTHACNVLHFRLFSTVFAVGPVHGALNRFVVTFANARCSPPYPVWLIDLCFLANPPRELQDVLT